MTNPSRHEQLINAGWRYDAITNYYSAPGSASDGTQRMYDEAAAWLAYGHDISRPDPAAPLPPKASEPPTAQRTADPRRKEPE